MCLAPRPQQTRDTLITLQKEYLPAEFPSGVPPRMILQVVRPKQHAALSHFEKLLATGRMLTARLSGRDLANFRDDLARIEGFLGRGKVKEHALEVALKIGERYVPTLADVASIHDELDKCGRDYVYELVCELRHALRDNVCTCCPAEYVPRRAYFVLPKETESLAKERLAMQPLIETMHRGLWLNPLGMVEDRGFVEGLREQRNTIGTGRAPGFDQPVCIPYERVKSAKIRRHLDVVRVAGDMASRVFPLYHFPRGEPVADQRFLAEWARRVAPRLVQWMNDIRNLIIDELNAMLAPELKPLLPRIEGVGFFPDGWIPVGSVVTRTQLDLAALVKEYESLMQFALDHRSEDPLPPPKPVRRPPSTGSRGARLMPLPPKPPRKSPRASKTLPPRDRPPPRAA